MKRRQFLKNVSALTLPWSMGLPGLSGLWGPQLLGNGTDRVLIIIRLIGGCDGLNAFIPLDQYGALQTVRANILPTEKQLLKVGDQNAFHPSLTGFKSLFDQNRMTVVQNVGYPHQNRSHFRSADIWNTGSASDDYLETGWMGRYLDLISSGDKPDFPWAVSIGRTISETCQGLASNYGVAVNDPTKVSDLPYGMTTDWGSGPYAENMEFIMETIRAGNTFGALFEEKFQAGESLSDKYPENNTLAQQLRIIATMMAGGLQSPVYTVSMGGFDNHAGEVRLGNPLEGTFPGLMKNLGDALEAFWDDLALLGLEDRVIAMTYSEFGRKIRSNSSLGTDHGDAAPMFVFGSCLKQNIIGTNPIIDPHVGMSDGVPFAIDFRDVYGAILSDWFGMAKSDLVSVLPGHSVQQVDLIQPGCGVRSGSTVGMPYSELEVKVFPNPAVSALTILIHGVRSGEFDAVLLDSQNHVVRKWSFSSSGEREIKETVSITNLPAGSYVLRLVQGNSTTSSIVVLH